MPRARKTGIRHPSTFPLNYVTPPDITCATSTDKHVYVGTYTGFIHIFAFADHSPIRVLAAHTGPVVALRVCYPTGDTTPQVVSVSHTQVKIWEDTPASDMEPVSCNETSFTPVAVLVNERDHILIMGATYRLSLEPNRSRPGTWYSSSRLPHHAHRRYFNQAADILKTGTAQNYVIMARGGASGIFDNNVVALKIPPRAATPPEAPPPSARFGQSESLVTAVSVYKKTILVAYHDQSISVFKATLPPDPEDDVEVSHVRSTPLPDYAAIAAAPLPDGGGFVVISAAHTAWLVRASTGTVISDPITMRDTRPSSLTVIGNGNILSAGPAGKVTLWTDASSCKEATEVYRSLLPAAPESESDDDAPPLTRLPRCTICMDQPATKAYIPCGHYCICDSCLPQTRYTDATVKGYTCPLCTVFASSANTIFFP